ncbi:MAG: DUF2807 domain-containing protein [Saprospiraceae bacterium]|jgi:hypothetical protein|nr:DUF2807 domain-containing protein [Saprospiraceae bacterium]
MYSVRPFSLLLLIFSICIHLSYNYSFRHEVKLNKIFVSNSQIYLNGNATINVKSHTKNTVEYDIANKEEKQLQVEVIQDTLFITQTIKKKTIFNIFSNRDDDDFPILNVLIPNKIDELQVILLKNGDIIFDTSLTANEVSMVVIGNGDIMCNSDLLTQKCRLEVKGNGDIKVNQIKSDLLDCAVYGNGDIKIDQITTKNLIGKVDGNGDIDFGHGVADDIVTPNGIRGLIISKVSKSN